MEINDILSEIGLNEGEIKVYLSLLKLGPSRVNDLKKETKLHRTTIYDFIEKLINKGLINYVIKNNTKYYDAKDPEELMNYIEEKENNLKLIIPKLKNLKQSKKPEIKVEVYSGIEGLKTILNDILRTKKDIRGFGLEEKEFKDRLPLFMDQYFRKQKEIGIKEMLLVSEKTLFIFPNKHFEYRYIPEKFFNPNPTFVYGNKIANIVWNPLTIIITENKDLANSYEKYFEMLWIEGKKKKGDLSS